MKAAKAHSLKRNVAADKPLSELAPPELITAPEVLTKLGMSIRPAPSSAQALRDCIAHELERAERILLQRLGYAGTPEQLLDFLEARSALARSWH